MNFLALYIFVLSWKVEVVMRSIIEEERIYGLRFTILYNLHTCNLTRYLCTFEPLACDGAREDCKTWSCFTHFCPMPGALT